MKKKEFNLMIPKDAREYVAWFRKKYLKETGLHIDKIQTNEKEAYDLNNLSDEDVTRVANMLWRDIHLEIREDVQ